MKAKAEILGWVIALCAVGFLAGTQVNRSGGTPDRNLRLEVAQARCGVRVFEDGSSMPESDDARRDACYARILGEPLFQKSVCVSSATYSPAVGEEKGGVVCRETP